MTSSSRYAIHRSDESSPPRRLALPSPSVFRRLAGDAANRVQSQAAYLKSASQPTTPPGETRTIPLKHALLLTERLTQEATLRNHRLQVAMQTKELEEAQEITRLANTIHTNRKSLSLVSTRKLGNPFPPAVHTGNSDVKVVFTAKEAEAVGARLTHRKTPQTLPKTTVKSTKSEREKAEKAVMRLYPSKRVKSQVKFEEPQFIHRVTKSWQLGKTEEIAEKPCEALNTPNLSPISAHFEDESTCANPGVSACNKVSLGCGNTEKRRFPLEVAIPRGALDFVQRESKY